MNLSATLIDLAGSIALLLWGTHMVQTGVQRAFGANLRAILGSALKNRFRAFFAGIGVTALLQSSTATGLMTAGFAAGGLVELVPALAVMLGANVGTTLIVQVVSFDVASISPALILVGFLMFRRDSSTRLHDLGRVFIGLGLMLLALHQLLGLMTAYEGAPALRTMLGAISTQPVLDVFLAAGLTWAAHSSVAVVLLVMSLAGQGVVPPHAAFALVLGANLGTAINPLLEGVSGNDAAAKRLPLGNLLTRVIGVAIALALLKPIGLAMMWIDSDNVRAVADFHTLFNLVLAVLFFPLLTPYANLLRRLLPNRIDPADPSRPLYLDPTAKEVPLVALGAASREALRLADVLDSMILGASDALKQGDRRRMVETRRRDDILDHLNMAIKSYLSTLDPDEMAKRDQRRLTEILTFSMNLEQAGDVIDRNLLPHIAKRTKRGLQFSSSEQKTIGELLERLRNNLRMASSLFMLEDVQIARLLADEKIAFREAEHDATLRHFDRLKSSSLDKAQASALHLDILRDLKLLNSHLVAAAAYPVLERTGDLLQSRIAQNDR